MKIRKGFVTNSSSTSFLLISENDLSKEVFFKALGLGSSQDFQFIFEELFDKVSYRKTPIREFYESFKDSKFGSFEDFILNTYSQEILDKIKEAEQNGKDISMGYLDSETDDIETFFCTDSFIVDTEEVYLNYTECVW